MKSRGPRTLAGPAGAVTAQTRPGPDPGRSAMTTPDAARWRPRLRPTGTGDGPRPGPRARWRAQTRPAGAGDGPRPGPRARWRAQTRPTGTGDGPRPGPRPGPAAAQWRLPEPEAANSSRWDRGPFRELLRASFRELPRLLHVVPPRSAVSTRRWQPRRRTHGRVAGRDLEVHRLEESQCVASYS
jgi:hypothetical protein